MYRDNFTYLFACAHAFNIWVMIKYVFSPGIWHCTAVKNLRLTMITSNHHESHIWFCDFCDWEFVTGNDNRNKIWVTWICHCVRCSQSTHIGCLQFIVTACIIDGALSYNCHVCKKFLRGILISLPEYNLFEWTVLLVKVLVWNWGRNLNGSCT
jgi:hypothetical protein